MITGNHLPALRVAGVDWVSALKSRSLKKLMVDGFIQQSLFEEVNLAEVEHADYPGERFIACRNPVLGRLRAHKRQELITATLTVLAKVPKVVTSGKLRGTAKICVLVGGKLGKYRVGKRIKLDIQDDQLSFEVAEANVAAEAPMDGIYGIPTSVPTEEMSAANAVKSYKRLAVAEKAFRTQKSIDLKVRPIHHHLPGRVKAHLLICKLAYYVRWHMERAWAALTFRDEETNTERDGVALAEQSAAATIKAQTDNLADGTPAPSRSCWSTWRPPRRTPSGTPLRARRSP